MKGGENQREGNGKIRQPLSVSPLNRGAFFPRFHASEQTRQACPDDRSARDESSPAARSAAEAQRPVFLTNPQRRAAKISRGQSGGLV